MKTKARFDPVGLYGAQPERQPAVSRAGDVKVYYASSPEGFSLKENELKVEAGFAHEILGTLTVRWTRGSCDGQRGRAYKKPPITRDMVVQQLRDAAFERGANAVIYATSRISDEPTFQELCPNMEAPESYGSGWAVIVR